MIQEFVERFEKNKDKVREMLAYGSCCGCDTLQSITDCSGSAALDDLMTLALHIVQGLKKMDGEWV